jgi:hypothetical protein
MMEAVSTSEMSVSFYQAAWCNIPEDSHVPFLLFEKLHHCRKTSKLANLWGPCSENNVHLENIIDAILLFWIF